MHALITGASSGIGEALARSLAADGYDLTLVARRERELHRVATSLSARVTTIAADLGETGKLSGIVDRAINERGPIDVLVNNAGITIVDRTHEIDPDRAEELLRINLTAPLLLVRHVMPA